jgi:hypothetical protein
MIALPSERSAGGVRAGINATAGARQSDIENTKRIIKNIVTGRVDFNATHGISAKRSAETGAP